MKEISAKFDASVFVSVFLAYTFYTWNRKCVPFVLPSLIAEGLPKDIAGSITSAQNLAYAVSKFVIGVLSDRIGARLLLTTGLFFSGLTAVAFPLFGSSFAFILLWACNGLMQGCGWPACVKILKQKYPASVFGTLWSVLSCSSNLAGLVSAVVSTYLILNYGWTWSVVFAGITSVLIAGVCFLTIDDTPTQNEELKHKKDDGDSSNIPEGRDEKKQTWKDVIRLPFVQLISAGYFVMFCTKTCCTDWAQLYLIEDLKVSQVTAGVFMGSMEIGGFVGCLTAGYISDWMIKYYSTKPIGNQRGGNPRLSLVLLYVVGLCVTLHLFCFNVYVENGQFLIAILGFLFGVCLYGPITIYGVVASECVPGHLSGTTHAVVALSANVGGILAGLPFTTLAQNYSWWAVFFALEVLNVATLLLLLYNHIYWIPIEKPKTHVKSS